MACKKEEKVLMEAWIGDLHQIAIKETEKKENGWKSRYYREFNKILFKKEKY